MANIICEIKGDKENMIKIDAKRNESFVIKGDIPTIGAELSMVIRKTYELVKEEIGEEGAKEYIEFVVKRGMMTEMDVMREAILGDDEIKKILAMGYCSNKAKSDDKWLEFLGDLVKELEEGKNS